MNSSLSVEPMVLGSPVGSPKADDLGSSTSQFVPPYLFGASSSGHIDSPIVKGDRQTSFHIWRSPSHEGASPANRSSAFQDSRHHTAKVPITEKTGPPTKSLCLDRSHASKNVSFINESFGIGSPFRSNVTGGGDAENSRFGHQFSADPVSSFASPAQIDPFCTQGDNLEPSSDLDETWVTVFGFPDTATEFILEQFQQYGTILHHEVSGHGNWMHIHYQSKVQAKKALSKNTKIYNGCIQIGVTPCIAKEVIARYRDHQFTEHSPIALRDSCNGIYPTLLDGGADLSSPLRPRYGSGCLSRTPLGATASGGTKSSEPVPRSVETGVMRIFGPVKDPTSLNPTAPSGSQNSSSHSGAGPTVPSKPAIRSLTAAYEASNKSSTDDPSLGSSPDKSLLSRTVHTLLGW